MSFVSPGIASAKHMVKQGEKIFFLSGKKLESSYFNDNKWKKARIISST